MEFYKLEPWLFEDNWTQTGMICSTVANSVPRKKGCKPFTPKNFIPKSEQEKNESDYYKEKAEASLFFAAMKMRFGKGKDK